MQLFSVVAQRGYHLAMAFSIITAMDEASGLDTWTAAYENIMCALGFSDDDPAYFAEAMAHTAIDEDIAANWRKATPAQRQWMVTQIVSHEVNDSFDRRLAASKDMVERLKEHVRRQKEQ
jgi:hypothetical protein